MRVYSIFNSISGEVGGVPQGTLTTFVRLAGCNLRCVFCDTKKTWTAKGAVDMMPEQVLARVQQLRCKHVLITGGEPMLQEETLNLIGLLLNAGYQVSVETNGSIKLPNWASVNWIVDYKLSGSGMRAKMKARVFQHLPHNAWVKFVCASLADLKAAVAIKKRLQTWGVQNFAVSPVIDKINPAEMIDYLQANRQFDIVFSLQIHKFIWPQSEQEK